MMEDYGAMSHACEKGMLIDKDDAHLLFLYAKACLGQGDVINTIAMLTKSILLAENCRRVWRRRYNPDCCVVKRF